uniref:Retrotransposon protein n=1 Tax=Panagrellus redivivus TaxID=6233 RepID=A0A7E4ZXK1_PANRE
MRGRRWIGEAVSGCVIIHKLEGQASKAKVFNECMVRALKAEAITGKVKGKWQSTHFDFVGGPNFEIMGWKMKL